MLIFGFLGLLISGKPKLSKGLDLLESLHSAERPALTSLPGLQNYNFQATLWKGFACNLYLSCDINELDEMSRHQNVLRSWLNTEITTVCAYDEKRGFVLIQIPPVNSTASLVSVRCRRWPTAPNLPLLWHCIATTWVALAT